MDDSRNRPGVGIFRIFQQSLKEMGSVMEHKRTTQGHKERETAHDKGVVRDGTAVDADRHVNKVDPKTNSDKLESFTSETNDEKHKFTSNYVRKGSRGVSDRKIKLLQSKYHRRPDRSSTVSANASRLPPYKRHKSPVKRVSPQEKHFTDMSASLTHERRKDNRNIADSEDWSNELIDVTVDSNHNIVELLSPEPFIDSAGQNVQNSKDIERNQKTDSINNEENNNTYNEINGNIQTCLNPITFLENKTKLGIENNESKTELENLNLKIEHNGNHGISNVNRTSMLDVNNSNSIEHYSSKKPSEKYKHTSTEDWSLELDEVDVDLFILQKSRNTSTPLGFSSHEESNTSKEQSCPISGKVENDSEHSFQVEIRSEPVVPSTGGPNSNIWFEMQNDVQLETKADNLSNPALATEIKTEPNIGLLITKSENNNINHIVKHSEVESQVLCQMSTSKENASFNVVSEIQAPEKGCSMKEFDQAIEIKATDEREGSELAEMKGTEDMNLNSYTDFKDKSKGSMENLNTSNKLNERLDGAEITINKGFGQNKKDDRSDMKVKDELLQVIDLKIKTDISRKGFVEHVQRRVESKVDRNTGVCNQNKEVRRHFDERASQSNVRDKRNDSSSGFSRNSKLRNNLNYNERLSSNHNDDMIPPRFRKQPSPINANKISNNKYGHATSTSLIPNLRPTYPDDGHFQRRKGFDNLGRVNENRFGSNVIDQIPAADSQRSTHHENKVNIKSEINKRSNLKAIETSVHVPENWHDEIDNTMHLAEKAMENSDNENNNNVMIVAEAGSENCQCKQKVSNDQTCKKETCHLPKSVPWRINEVEKLEISVENIDKLVETDIQREKVPYLPPSPDELEQASFMTFLTKSGNDIVKSDNTVDIENDLTAQKPDEKNQNVDNNDLTFSLDLQSDQGFDASSANEQWVAVSKNELEKIAEAETHQTECVDNGSFNNTESLEGTDERVVTGNSETDSRLDARVLTGCENCEENDKIAVSGRLDSETNDGTESALNASFEFVADNVDEKSNREIETQIIIPEKCDVVHGHGNFIVNTNDFIVEENVITSNEVEEDKGKFKASPTYIQAERGRTKPSNRIGYPPTGPREAHPSQFYGNQFYQSQWQHCHPSYYYSEQYRRWYEQVYVPQYQRYMQLYGYYGVPDDYYGQPYSDDVRPSHGLDRDRQTVEGSHEQRVQRRTHSGEINRQMSEERQKQNETESHKAFTSIKISNPTEEASKEKVLENKLSDYWADRMPDWVDKQCKIAKLKNETQGEDDNVVKPNELDLKTQKSNNQIASETRAGTKLKRETVKSEIEKQVLVKIKLDEVNGNNSDFKGSGYKHESVNSKEELKSLMSNAKEGIKRHDNKTTVLAEKTPLSDTKKEDVRTAEEASKADKGENENSLKKDISLVDMATSDSNPVLTASDSDSFLQPKTGCTCGPDDIQYFLCKTCQCSAGRVPAPEDFVHVYPEERCMDQGYQSFDSLGK